MVVIPNLRLGYQNVPKVATTSLFSFLYMALYGIEYNRHIVNKVKTVHQYFLNGLSADSVPVANILPITNERQNYYRFAITRDPIKRFISMYSNRVVFHRELSESHKDAHKLAEAGLAYNPQINELVDKFYEYMEVQQSIFHHARPQMDFLGPDLSVYTRIADISSVNEVIGEIRAFWMREGMVEISERAPTELDRRQTGGPKLLLNVLSPNSFEKLLEYYRKDYEQLSTLSLQGIKDEYHKARLAGGPVPEVFKTWGKVSASDAVAVAKQPIRTQIKVKKEACALTELLRLNLPEEIMVAKPFVLNGAVVLKGVPKNGWKLVVDNGVKSREMEWGLSSPALAERFPDNPDAGMARFRLDGVRLSDGKLCHIWLESADSQRHLLATLSASL